jgi:hypothetical protein
MMDRYGEPIIRLNHADLTLYDPENSRFKALCPRPGCDGLLLGGRSATGVLQEFDRCVLCGQQVQYLDIGELRHPGLGKTDQQEYEEWVAAGMPGLIRPEKILSLGGSSNE